MNLKESKFTDGSIVQRLREIESLPENVKNIEKVKSSILGSGFQYSVVWIVMAIVCFLAYVFLQKSIFLVIMLVLLVTPELFLGSTDSSTFSYVRDFAVPTLREVLPDTTVKYYSGIETPYLRAATPVTHMPVPFFHISFGDEVNTDFCNLRSTHEKIDMKGNRETKIDFEGQILMVKHPTGLNGYLRIIPTKQVMFGMELLNGHKEKQPYETKIETEDIRFNENHEVYCMDELSTRTLLNPHILNLLTRWVDIVPVGVYIDDETVVLSFHTKKFLFQIPESALEIEELSLADDYEELQEELSLMYEILGTMNT